MKREDIINLYNKERNYQKIVFGEYGKNPALNLGSFLIFLRNYLDRANESYTKNWIDQLPSWLENCTEMQSQGSAPVMTYNILVEIMTLAGAALETYTNVNVEEWRKDFFKSK